jgi:hypothetical protein
MSPLWTRGSRVCAFGLAVGVALGGSGLASAVSDAASDATIGAAIGTSGVDSVAFANKILDRWQAVAQQAGQNPAAWRDLFGTQLTKMNASILQGIDAVVVDPNNAQASYAQFGQAVRNAVMQSYTLAQSGKAPLKLGSTTTDQVFIPIVPCRIVDTRNVGGPIAANATDNFYFWSDIGTFSWSSQGGAAGNAGTACPGTVNPNGGSPSAAVVTVTVVSPTAAGNFIIWGGANPVPNASALNWTGPGQILANTTVIPWGGRTGSGPGGTILDFAVEYNGPSGSAQFVADVVGYMVENNATALDCTNVAFTPIASSSNDVVILSTACPAGYTATTLNCASSAAGGDGVHLIKSFLNPLGAAGTPINGTCRWENTGGSSQSYWGYNTCCRVPGR